RRTDLSTSDRAADHRGELPAPVCARGLEIQAHARVYQCWCGGLSGPSAVFLPAGNCPDRTLLYTSASTPISSGVRGVSRPYGTAIRSPVVHRTAARTHHWVYPVPAPGRVPAPGGDAESAPFSPGSLLEQTRPQFW